jgi:hypothetical protein
MEQPKGGFMSTTSQQAQSIRNETDNLLPMGQNILDCSNSIKRNHVYV